MSLALCQVFRCLVLNLFDSGLLFVNVSRLDMHFVTERAGPLLNVFDAEVPLTCLVDESVQS